MENLLIINSFSDKNSLASKREKVMVNLFLMLLFAGVIESIFTFTFVWLNSFMGIDYAWTNVISKIIYVGVAIFLLFDFLFIMLNKKTINKNYMIDKLIFIIVIFVVSGLLFYYSYGKFVNFRDAVLTNYMVFFTNCLLTFYVALNIEKPVSIFRGFKPFIIIAIIYLLLYLTIYSGPDIGMNIAYGILPATLMSFLYAIRSTRIKMTVYIVICIFLNLGLVFLGNRWSLLISVAFMGFIFVLFINKKLLVKASLWIVACVLILVTLVVIFDEQIANLVPSFRIINLIQSNELFTDNARLSLWSNGIYESFRNPIEIKGVLYDRYYYVTAFNGNSDLGIPVYDGSFSEIYAHNIFVEVLLHFGWIFGSVIFVFLAFIIISSFFKSKSINRMVVIMLVFAGFMQLLVSFSYLLSASFWGMLGILIKFNCNMQNEKKVLLIDGFKNQTSFVDL